MELEAGEVLHRQSGPGLRAKKKRRDRLIAQAVERPDWVVGYLGECWFSRLAQPGLHAWMPQDVPLPLWEKEREKGDTAAKALACYGLLLEGSRRVPQMLLRFVEGRPVSNVTTAFLSWVVAHEALEGCRVLVLFWDNATWHVSKEVQAWIRGYNREAKGRGKPRLLVCPLPKKSPWLNAIEPKWVHGKRAVCEARRVLSPEELQRRLYRYYRAQELPPLRQKL